MCIFIYIKNLPAAQGRRFYPWVGKNPWRRKWQLTPIFLPRKCHGQRSLAGYSPWGHKRVGHNQNNNTWDAYLNFVWKKKFWESIYESLISGGTSRLPFRKTANLRAALIPWIGYIYLQWRKWVHSFDCFQFQTNQAKWVIITITTTKWKAAKEKSALPAESTSKYSPVQ